MTPLVKPPLSEKRTSASVRAATYCDLMALGVGDFHDVVRNFPTFASIVDRLAGKIAGTRSVSGASPTRGSVSGKWGSALAQGRGDRSELELRRQLDHIMLARRNDRHDLREPRAALAHTQGA